MPLIKVAYLMLNFLNLKSFPLILFFWVASSLSMVWKGHVGFQNKNSRSLFTIIFKPKMVISRVKILVHLYSSRARWCVMVMRDKVELKR